jgi:Right handed beta helix region
MQQIGCSIRSCYAYRSFQASLVTIGFGSVWLFAFLGVMPASVVGQLAAVPVQVVATIPAVGDGKADDTEAIQRLIDSHASSIAFAPGRYRITRPLKVDLDKSGFVSFSGNGVATIVMEGAGPAIRFIGTHQGTADPNTVKGDVWDRQRAPMMDGIEIVGSHPEAEGVEANGTMQLTLTRLIVRNVLHAIHLANRNRNVLIANCHLYENRGVGIYLDNVDLHQINVNACHISYNQQGGIVSRQGNVRNLHVNGCDIESNMSPSTPPTANILIDCRESSSGTAEVAISGCTIQHNSKSKDSANIRIIGNGLTKADQPEVRWGNVTITGNVLSDVATNVHLSGCRGVALQGNTFWMGYEHNLLVEDCNHIVVGPNNLDRNPRYDYGNAAKSKNAIVFRNSDDCTIQGLHVTNVHDSAAGLELDRCRRFNVNSCTILDCDGPGLLLRSVSQSLITGCLIRDDRDSRTSGPSLRIETSQDNTLSNNVLSHGSETLPKAKAG